MLKYFYEENIEAGFSTFCSFGLIFALHRGLFRPDQSLVHFDTASDPRQPTYRYSILITNSISGYQPYIYTIPFARG